MTRSLLVVACVLVLVACGDSGAVRLDVDASANRWFPGTPLQIGVADDVGAWIDHTLVGRMRREVGASMPIPLEGRRCELAIVRTFTEQRSDPQNERRKISREMKYDYYNGAEVELRCADGPAPGAAATKRGADPRKALVWILPGVVLGFLAGRTYWSDGGEDESVLFAFAGVALIAASVVAPIVIAIVMFDDLFRMTIGALLLGLTGVAMLAGAQWRVHPIASVAGVVASVAGAVGFGARLTAWSYAAPVAALGVAAGAWVVAMIIVLSIWPSDQMEKRASAKRIAAYRRKVAKRYKVK